MPERETVPVPVSAAPGTGEIVDGDAREAEAELFQRLKAVRTSLARECGVPPYVVFADRSLRRWPAPAPATGRISRQSPASGRSNRRNQPGLPRRDQDILQRNRQTDLQNRYRVSGSHYLIPNA